MPKKNVYLLPGFGASDLGVLATGDKLWWDIAISPAHGLGGLKLAANGVDPDPVIGERMGVSTDPQDPWGDIEHLLRLHLDQAVWQVQAGVYDFRLDLLTQAQQLADNILARSTPEFPATIVGHSAGGLIAVAAWKRLNDAGKSAYVRRVITIGTPHQGSYMPVLWLTGALGMVQELTAVLGLINVIPGINPAQWELAFLNQLALSWPSFYELFPFAVGTEADADPNRRLLYVAANYPRGITADQHWLDYSKDTFQPLIQGADAAVPSWVLTTVAGVGIGTPSKLGSANVPIRFNSLLTAEDGDGIVTRASALVPGSRQVTVPSSHSSIPLGLTVSGDLAALIRDERIPPLPPPPLQRINLAIQYLVTDPPESDPQSPIICIGGG